MIWTNSLKDTSFPNSYKEKEMMMIDDDGDVAADNNTYIYILYKLDN